jgi:sulfatase modifying factor 1
MSTQDMPDNAFMGAMWKRSQQARPLRIARPGYSTMLSLRGCVTFALLSVLTTALPACRMAAPSQAQSPPVNPAEASAATTGLQVAEGSTTPAADSPNNVPTTASADGSSAAPTAAGSAAPAVEPTPGGPGADRVAEACEAAPPGTSCVPGGPFIRGVDVDDHACNQPDMFPEAPGTGPAMTIWLDTFYMDTHEVTNAGYEACVAARACEDAGPAYVDFDADEQAITGISWFHAVAYCEWRGMHLPTEAEWEKAARGPDADTHPWGNAPSTCENAILMDASGRSCGRQKRGNRPEAGRVNEVGARPAGRYGLYDMMGNAEEWVADWWSADYAACGDACAGANPRGPCDGALECDGHTRRVVRGGSWYWEAGHSTGYHRRRHFPANAQPNFHHFGFRCAASMEEARALAAEGTEPLDGNTADE